MQHTTYPYFLMLGQPVIMKLLDSILDTPVQYKCPLESLSETENGATITLDNVTIESKYVIGADGARSKVRQSLNIEFEGTKPEMVWAVLDTFLDTDFPTCPEIITFQVDGQARVSWIPRLVRCHSYLLHRCSNFCHWNQVGNVEWQDFTSCWMLKLLKLMPKTKFGSFWCHILLILQRQNGSVHLKVHQLHGFAYTYIYVYSLKNRIWSNGGNLVKERLARTYFSSLGRIILAGDAAHVHAVNGGQGLNTGISDAFALIWRLYLACKGHPSMITSYEQERRHIAADVLSIASKLVRSTLRTATEYVEIVEKNAAYITGRMGTNI